MTESYVEIQCAGLPALPAPEPAAVAMFAAPAPPPPVPAAGGFQWSSITPPPPPVVPAQTAVSPPARAARPEPVDYLDLDARYPGLNPHDRKLAEAVLAPQLAARARFQARR